MAILSTTTNYPLVTSGAGWTLNGPSGSGIASSGNGKWVYKSTTTSSSDTGPSVPPPGPDAYYWYTETSSTSLGAVFTMELDDTLDADTYNYIIDFWYSNYGINGGGECLVQYWNGASWDTVQTIGWDTTPFIPSSGTGSGGPWKTATQIDLSSYSNADGKLRWHFTTGGGTTYQNDFSLDDITITVEAASFSSSSRSSSSRSSSSTSKSSSSKSSSSSSTAADLNHDGLYFNTSGDANWFLQGVIQESGSTALQAGDISDNQSTRIDLVNPGTGVLSFYMKVSSEESFDYMNFYINGNLDFDISGETGWLLIIRQIYSGDSFYWIYTKDGSVSDGWDTAWLDTFVFVADSSSSSSSSRSSSSRSSSSSSQSSSSSSESNSSSSSDFNRFAEDVIFGENTIADIKNVTKDTYLDEAAPDVTFTGSTELTFKRDSEFVNIVLIKFDLKHLEGMVFDAIDSARLYFKTISTPDGVMVGVYGVNKLWESQHVTWRYATDPNRFWDLEGAHNWREEAGIGDHRYHGDTKTPTTKNTWYYWDVTGAVRDQYNRGEYNGFILRFPIEDGDDVFGSVEFHGSTSDPDNRPYLYVNVTPGSSSSSSSSTESSSSSSSSSTSSTSTPSSTSTSSSSLSSLCIGTLTGSNLVDSVSGNGLSYPKSVWADDNFVYVGADGLFTYTYDLDGNNLTFVDSDDQGGEGYGVWGDGNFVYLAQDFNGIQSYSVDGSGNITWKDSDQYLGKVYSGGVWGDGNFIYTGAEDYLLSYSVDGAGNLTFIDADSQVSFANGVHQIWGDGTYIYVAEEAVGILTYSVDGSGNLNYLHTAAISPGSTWGVWGDGTFLYGSSSDGFRVFTIAGDGSLTQVGFSAGGAGRSVMGRNGGIVYVVDSGDGIITYSIDGAGNPTQLSAHDLGSGYEGVHVQINNIFVINSVYLYSYLGCGYSVSSSSSSSSESATCAGELTYIDVDYQGFPGGDNDVWTDGNFIYVTNDSQGLFTYSADGSGNLTHIDTDKQGFDSYRGVCGDGTFIYCACNTDGLRSYSVNGSGILTYIDVDKQGTTGYGNVWCDSNFIYVAGGSNGLHSYSADGSGNLTYIDTDYQAAFQGEYQDVWGDGNFIYCACHNQGLRSYSVDGSGNLTYIDVDDQGGDYRGVWGDGTYIYAAAGNNGLRVYSVDGGGNLTYIGVDYQGTTVYDHVWGDGIYIYVANWSNGLRSYEVDGSGNLTYIDVDVQNDGEFLDVYMRVWGDGNFIYVACNTGGLRSYEVCLDSPSLVLRDANTTGGYASGTSDDGTFVYTANGFDGLSTYSVDGFGNITIIDSVDDGGLYRDVFSDGTFAYAVGDFGLRTYTVDGSGNLGSSYSDQSHLTSTDYYSVYSDGNFVYIGTQHGAFGETEGYIIVHTVNGSGNITATHSYPFGTGLSENVGGITGDGNFIYTATGQTYGVLSYSVDGGGNITLIDSAKNPVNSGYHDIWIDPVSGIIYASGSDAEVTSFSVDGSGNLTVVDQFDYIATPNHMNGMTGQRKNGTTYLFLGVTSPFNIAYIITADDSGNFSPSIVTTSVISNDFLSVWSDSNFYYASEGSDGLRTWELVLP